MSLRAVAYVSTAVAGLGTTDLDHLLVDARAHNQLAGVTGVLLFDGQQFFQYFEGPEEGVARAYERIRNSHMHVDLRELYSAPVDNLHFSQWHMGCTHTEGSVLQQLSTQQWQREAEFLQDDIAQSGASPALRELLAFWTQQNP
ncbi:MULTISPECIES: BLUF domain-containing protein [unclassified Stenotrophomonas]|uniref:BLUF domain-containing protein n=1 Tax=unclassified Stenotrophomonas TaxID=196198 RepID=UPI0025F64238|nr:MULTISPECIES: BLUF domain-containing protein [unclassified Stenotrophomonas]